MALSAALAARACSNDAAAMSHLPFYQ